MNSAMSLYKLITGEYQNFLAVNSVDMMNIISHQIENTVIDGSLPVDFYAGFQRYSAFLAQRKRYERLAAIGRRVFVFGIPDCPTPVIPGVQFVPLDPEDNLTKEWFLVINAPYFYTALLTREVTGEQEASGKRRFKGLWTHDEQIVSQAYLVLAQQLNQEYQPIAQRDYHRQNNYIVGIANNLVTRLEQSNVARSRSQQLSAGINQVAAAVSANQDYENLLDKIVTDLQKSFKTRTVTIWQPQPKEQVIDLIAAAGLPGNWRQAIYRQQPLEQTDVLAAKVFVDGNSYTIHDAHAENTPDPFDPAVRSIAAIPMRAQGRLQGVLQVTDHRPNAYDEEMLKSLETIGTQIALAMLGVNQTDKSVALPGLNASEDNSWAVLDSTLDSVLVLSAQKQITFVNSAARHLFSVSSNKSLAGKLVGALGNDEFESIIASIEPTMGMVYSDIQLKEKSYLVGIAPAFDETEPNKVIHWTVVLREIGEALGKEGAVVASTGTLIARLKIRDELLQRMQLINRLATHLPEMGQLSNPQNHALEEITKANHEMNDIVSQLSAVENNDGSVKQTPDSEELVEKLLLIEQVRSGAGERQTINLKQLVDEIIAEMTPLTESKRIELYNKLPDDLPPFYTNRLHLKQAIVELVDNAIKYNAIGTKVEILIHADDKKVTIAVRDTGIGIWHKDIPFLFERFYRVRSPQSLKIPGKGLGLSLVKAFALGHGGKAWVSGKIGQGSTFIIELPQVQAEQTSKPQLELSAA